MATFPLLLLLLLLHSIISSISAAPESALITKVPGFTGTLPSKHYGGYVTVDDNSGRNLYYYFVESETDPAKDPLVLWLNGGPGCSSFDGFVYENGPFNFQAGEKLSSLPKLELNPYSWSKVSNIIYLDSPSGVGLSYSKNSSDYKTGDLKTASDSHTFLLKWFELYPEFLQNPFFISGESYAGIYIPTLASEVAKGREAGIKPVINFKGYMIGNGCTDRVFDGDALVPFAYGMGLVSDNLFKEVNVACQGSYWNPVNTSCSNKLDEVDQLIGDLNIYDILEPCYHKPEIRSVTSDDERLPRSFLKLGETNKLLPVRVRMFGRAWPLRAPVKEGRVPTWPELGTYLPCTSDEVANAWLNDDLVRKSIHAELVNSTFPWEICTSRIEYYHDAGSMIPYHRNLTMKGYRALIYSGDHDMCVPFTGSKAWTGSMGYKVIDKWRPWMAAEQVAGYTQGYDHNLTFLTIKGAGHAVPEYKPAESLAFYSRWMAGAHI